MEFGCSFRLSEHLYIVSVEVSKVTHVLQVFDRQKFMGVTETLSGVPRELLLLNRRDKTDFLRTALNVSPTVCLTSCFDH